MDAAGKPVPAALTHDALTNQLYLTLSKPFASDGSVDGAYTLNVLLIDKAGNSLISRFAVVYDSQVPQVSSVEVNTAGGSYGTCHETKFQNFLNLLTRSRLSLMRQLGLTLRTQVYR